jgi:hypothetical protein
MEMESKTVQASFTFWATCYNPIVKSGDFSPNQKRNKSFGNQKKTKTNKPWSNSLDSNLDEVETLNNMKMSLHFRPLHIHMHMIKLKIRCW